MLRIQRIPVIQKFLLFGSFFYSFKFSDVGKITARNGLGESGLANCSRDGLGARCLSSHGSASFLERTGDK